MNKKLKIMLVLAIMSFVLVLSACQSANAAEQTEYDGAVYNEQADTNEQTEVDEVVYNKQADDEAEFVHMQRLEYLIERARDELRIGTALMSQNRLPGTDDFVQTPSIHRLPIYSDIPMPNLTYDDVALIQELFELALAYRRWLLVENMEVPQHFIDQGLYYYYLVNFTPSHFIMILPEIAEALQSAGFWTFEDGIEAFTLEENQRLEWLVEQCPILQEIWAAHQAGL